jgi:hypothetical protein
MEPGALFLLYFSTQNLRHIELGGREVFKEPEGGLKGLGVGVLREGFDRGSLALEGVYSGYMGWVHAPPSPLAAPPNFLLNCIILAYLLEILVFFCDIFCTSNSSRVLCAYRWNFHLKKI